MAKAHVKKLTLVGLAEDRKAVSKLLHKLGCVQIDSLRDAEAPASIPEADESLRAKLEDVTFALDFLDKCEKFKRGMLTQKPVYTEEEMQLRLVDAGLWQAIDAMKVLDGRRHSLKMEETRLLNQAETLQPWKDFSMPLGAAEGTRWTRILLGSVPTNQIDALEEALAADDTQAAIMKVGVEKDMTYCAVIVHEESLEAAQALLRAHSFLKADLHGVTGLAADELGSIEARKAEITAEYAAIDEEAKTFLPQREDLQILSDYLNVLMAREQEADKFFRSAHTFVLSGWIDELDEKRVEEAVAKVASVYSFETSEAEEGEEPPVLVHNSKFVTPFEMVTNLYSSPSNADLDPTPWITPFFIFFFGMMLGDVGYGLIVTALCGFYVWKMKPTGTMGSLFRMMIPCGISTMFWGVLYGSYFGDLFGIKPLWISPSDDPMTVLIVSFVFGVIHLFTGMAAQMVKAFKKGDWQTAIFDNLTWMILIPSLVLLALPQARMIGIVLSVAMVLVLLATQGRHKKGFGKIVGGLGSLYNITSYLSDILSYARLLALGLATGIIANVMNTLSKLFGTGVFGIVMMIIILIVGHVFNLVINILGTFVHTARLQYVEYFGKFYDGGGQLFAPFRIKTKFTNYKESEDM